MISHITKRLSKNEEILICWVSVTLSVGLETDTFWEVLRTFLTQQVFQFIDPKKKCLFPQVALEINNHSSNRHVTRQQQGIFRI